MSRFAGVAGLGGMLCACNVSAGGLDANEIEPLRPDISESTQAPTLDAAPEPSAEPIDAALVEGRVDAGAGPEPCPVWGTYALTLDADVHWEGTRLFEIVPIILPGDGKVRIQTLIEIAPEGPAHPVVVRACGAELPDFASSVGEVYGADFPAESWDRLPLRWSTRASFACASVGCTFSAEPVNAQLGIELPDDAVWPSPRDVIPLSAQHDDDGDGLPGLRIVMRDMSQGLSYRHPPSSFLLAERVSEIELAIRLRVTLDGTLASCDTRSGRASSMTLEIRALACRLESGAPCDAAALGFVDDNLPVWTVRMASFQARRVRADATCADARK